MKILYGTTNVAKLDWMQKNLQGLDIEMVCLRDIAGEIPDVPETGSTPLENAIQKAQAYYKAFGMPVFSCDSGLFFENLPEYSPGVHVRTVDGKYLTDDEMIAYYSGLAREHGDIIAQYQNAICFVPDEEHIYTDTSEDLHGDRFIITAVPHPKRVEGFPLDSISKTIDSGVYYYDLEQDKNMLHRNGWKRFFEEVLKNNL